jgi:hypothetical protein
MTCGMRAENENTVLEMVGYRTAVQILLCGINAQLRMYDSHILGADANNCEWDMWWPSNS